MHCTEEATCGGVLKALLGCSVCVAPVCMEVVHCKYISFRMHSSYRGGAADDELCMAKWYVVWCQRDRSAVHACTLNPACFSAFLDRRCGMAPVYCGLSSLLV